MPPIDFEQTISDTEIELAQKIEERDAADKRIGQLTLALRGMAASLPPAKRQQLLKRLAEARRRPTGLTEAIKEVLSESKDGMTGTEIRAQLENTGFDFSEYVQPMATVHVVLKRLLEKDIVKRRGTRNGSYVYHWVGECL
jgi:hypothetical protein